MLLLIMTFFGILSQSILDILRGQVQISGLFIFDVLATILLNQFSILLQAQEYNSIGGSSFLFKLRFQTSILLDSLCFILSMPLISTASRFSEFGHGFGLCAAQSLQILFCMIIVSINNDNNLGYIKYQNASEIPQYLNMQNEDDKGDTMKELLDHSNHCNEMESAISTRQSSEINNSISSISTEDNQIKITLQNHIDVNAITRSKMFIQINSQYVKIEDLYVSNFEIQGKHEESVVLQELNLNQITDENKQQSLTIKRRWTEILLMKKELSLQLEPYVYESLPNIEDTFLYKAEQLHEVSIKARKESLNQFLKELILLDAKLECFSNFFNNDNYQSNTVNEEFERTSYRSDSKGMMSEFINRDDNISISENDTLCEMESVSHMSSTSSNSVLVVQDNTEMIPTAVIQQNIKLTAKQKFICPEDNVTQQCRIQLSILEWNHELKKSFKDIHLLWQFLKQHCDIHQEMRSEREVKKELIKSSQGEVVDLSDEDLDNLQEELRSEYEDFLQYVVREVKQLQYKRVREFLQLPHDLNDLINV